MSVDAIDVALPTPLHREFSVRALQSGHDVIVEKPLAPSLEDADAIVAACDNGRLLLVGHVLRFWDQYARLREIVLSGRLGKPLAASAWRLSNMPQWAAWFKDPTAAGGAVVDLQIHDLDMLNWLFGAPVCVSSVGVKDSEGGWNHVMTSLEYASVSAATEASFMMPQDFPFSAGLRVLCEEGAIEYLFRAPGASFEAGMPQDAVLVHQPGKPNQPVQVEPVDPFAAEMKHFAACVRSGEPSIIVTPADARLALQVALATRRSLETGQKITLRDS